MLLDKNLKIVKQLPGDWSKNRKSYITDVKISKSNEFVAFGCHGN
jgi:hypothetical protein